jgi:hypothetical protein
VESPPEFLFLLERRSQIPNVAGRPAYFFSVLTQKPGLHSFFCSRALGSRSEQIAPAVNFESLRGCASLVHHRFLSSPEVGLRIGVRLAFRRRARVISGQWVCDGISSDKRDYRMQLFDPRGGALASGNSRASSS